MSDIVERLRQIGDWIEPKVWQHDPTCLEAADEIERLRAANNRLHEQIEGLSELLVRVQEQSA